MVMAGFLDLDRVIVQHHGGVMMRMSNGSRDGHSAYRWKSETRFEPIVTGKCVRNKRSDYFSAFWRGDCFPGERARFLVADAGRVGALKFFI